MDEELSILQCIEERYEQLSKGQKKVAEFVLKNPAFIGVHSASEVGHRASTSETTVIRFCYALGLTGYAQLQKELTLHLFGDQKASSLGNYMSSKEALLQKKYPVTTMMGRISQQIFHVGEQIDEEHVQHIAQRMHNAKNIFLIGTGASKFSIEWLHFTLSILHANVQIVEVNSGAVHRVLQQVAEDSLVIVVSLHRYFKESLQLTKLLKNKGAHTVAITDSKVAPIASIANEAFILQQRELSTIDMMPSLIAFMNSLVAAMMGQDLAYYNEQRKQFDEIQNSFLADQWS